MNPQYAYKIILLSILALCFLIIVTPVLAADKDESLPPQQEESESQTTVENPFETKPEKSTWTFEESDTKSIEDKSETEEIDADISLRRQLLMPYLESLRRWKYPPDLGDLSELYGWQPRKKTDTKGIDLPMDSNLRITGFQSVTIEVNKTHYFGEGDLNRYGGYGYGSYGDYGSGLDLGLSSSYGYEDFGYSSGLGGGYGSSGSGYSSYGSGYSSYGRGGIPRATGINIRQHQKIGLHGRVGERTHIAVDYNAGDTYGGGYGGYGGSSSFGLGGTKEQKIKIWYEGKPDSIIKTISFGDITLSLPNTRFLNINRNLFGLEGVFEYKNTRFTAFGSRSKGIREVRTFRGQSRRASFGYGPGGIQVGDANYIKNRYYLIHQGEDGLLHEAYLPIKSGSVEIYIDDSVVGNNQGGQRTSRGYFNPQFPGQDYNIDYETGEIEFLSPISSNYTIVVAYEYLGDGGGSIGNPGNVFADENGDGSFDEEGEEIGYVTIKEKGFRGTAAAHVYFLQNRNINPRDFQLTIIRQGENETFQTDDGLVPYIEIFGLDQNGDGNVDPEFIDYDRGLLRFPSTRPFEIRDSEHPFYQYRDTLNNEAIYLESIRSTDQIYTIVADYSFQSETYNVGLFVIPESETVRLNGRLLTRDTDYLMIYEVGTIRFFTELDEFDEIVVEFEKTPFGGGTQQTVAGLWVEYTHKPKPKSPKEQSLDDRFNRLGGTHTGQPGLDNNLPTDPFSGGISRSGSGLGNIGLGGSGFGGGSFGSSGYSRYGGYGGRSRIGSGYYGGYGGTSNYFNPVFQKGFNISTGYILTTGQKPTQIPDVNSVPNRLQALNLNTSFGREFNIAWLVNPLPFVNVRNFPLSIDVSGESAFSHNNPNSVGVAIIDSMEGVKQTATIPTLKYNWKPSSVPYISEGQQVNSTEDEYNVIPTLENRALFNVVLKDREEAEAVGNYMRNRDVPASTIQPLSLSTEERLIMEVGYEFTDVVHEWGGFSNGVSKSGVDYSERGFIEMWLRVLGENDVTLYLNIGAVSEDADADERLDSEDLPQSLEDTNGDGVIDALDLDLENLSNEYRYRGNGTLDTGEDVGWLYEGALQSKAFGANNQILDSEDLNGDGVLDSVDAYFQVAIPLNEIPNEWIKSKNNNGWTFLNIPLTEFVPEGSRIPSLVFVQHFRFWLQKNRPGNVKGTFQWASIEIVGNRWQQGLVTRSLTDTTTGLADNQVVEDTLEKFIVGTKDNFSFDDYQTAYLEIENNDLFRKLHPFTATTQAFQTQQQREQTLSLEYYLFPGSYGITSKQLRGYTQSEGQDFSRHDTLRFWLYGDNSDMTFVLQLAPSVNTGYRSSFYSSDPFLNQPEQEDVNIFENLTDYYEYSVPIDFDGWKLIEIDLRDNTKNDYPDRIEDPNVDTDIVPQNVQPIPEENAPDGHPDGFIVRGTGSSVSSTRLSVKNIGGILLGIRNDTDREISGEIWVNEIHLGDPLIRSGWARRGDMSVSLGSIVRLRGGYASQDKDFESGAGEIGRQRLSSRGYSTTNNDYNINADITLFSWLPIRYSIREQESETEAQRGSYTTYQSGKSESLNRDISVNFNRNPYPNLGFAYNYQDFWNERQGTQISHLYTGSFGYNLGSKLGFNMLYRHEDIIAKPETATDTSTTTSSYYSYGYGRNRDEKTDSGSFTLNISPINAFSLNPRYEIRRTLEKRDQSRYRPTFFGTGRTDPNIPTEDEPDEEIEPNFTIAEREHRISLTPRLNRDLFGLRPTVTSRASFRENWFTTQKDASINGNVNLGLNFRIQKWFGWLFKKEEPIIETEETDTVNTTEGTNTQEPKKQLIEQLRDNDIDEAQIQKVSEDQSDWINRDKTEMDQKQVTNNTNVQGQLASQQPKPEGFVQRIINTLTINTSANYTAYESFRELMSGQTFIDIWNLEEDAEERTNSRKSNRYTIRTNVDPLKWLSFGTNLSTSDSFRKSYATTYLTHAETYEADIKLNAQQATSFQLRYSFTKQNTENLDVTISDSSAHTPSLSWLHKWNEKTRTSLGIRTTLRDHLRSGIESNAFIVTPNFSIDYRYNTEGGIRIPIFGRIPLKHDLDLTNTLSLAIRRENYGANREERSERYETTLRVGYKLSDHLTANLHLGVSYNNDRVEEGRDYLSIASALTVRGEFE